MENPRSEKVAVVEEVKARFAESDAVLLTEYRGLDVKAISELRRALSAAGGDYKVYKNTLVGFATRELGLELDEMLTGPTAIAFIATQPDGTPGDPVNVAKALRDFARANPNLVVKGGVLGENLLSADEAKALADVAPREELLARLAGGLAAPLQQFAGLLQALPRNFAYGLSALIEQGGAPGAPAAPAEDAAPAADDTSDTTAEAAPAEDETTPEATEASEGTTEAAEADDTETAVAEGDSGETPVAEGDGDEKEA
ncbi:50S ribosomal protein L10 [Actinomarinicola tropica]|uniref:Large ribosomal subunit protein uL10 n=1 Tax=Actinomarinicola tropica TaxID=2789776 RepID=A0A5Q2RDY3_9ACTN|nr:50S ribosomal protein L10 [Actinomarinicola tropica]QGG93843.1 50S ribosomal protein L10 [Actinomarinicola tropica]